MHSHPYLICSTLVLCSLLKGHSYCVTGLTCALGLILNPKSLAITVALWSVFSSMCVCSYNLLCTLNYSSSNSFKFCYLSPSWAGLSPKVLFKWKWVCYCLWAILEHSRKRVRSQNRKQVRAFQVISRSEAQQAWQGKHMRAWVQKVKLKCNCSNSLTTWEGKFKAWWINSLGTLYQITPDWVA